jgi:predicted nucleic acid-binding protein
MNTTVILDSSVIAKWFFSEVDTDKALEIKEKFTNNSISIAVPVLLYYEINNILKIAVNSFRIDPKEAVKVYNAFLKLNFITYSSELIMRKTLEIAMKFDISSYDAAYIALAEYLQIPFLTADRKLLDKVTIKLVQNIKNYKY